MAGLDNKISNIIGTKLPQWLLNQIQTRSRNGARDSRDNDNILYLANKTAWVRLVSSIDLINQSDVNYFNRNIGNSIANKSDLAKQFVLFGGTSKYLNKNSYQLRSGLGKDGAYGILGETEIQKYGYKPMPGITNVAIETQGRLGSVRSATINFKCWDKDQLDIIDALYFKLGFTMFLEWGNTAFYTSKEPNRIQSSELYAIDPFDSDISKEEIFIQISKNSRESEGNYDAMLGIATNFSFTLTQDGGFDCQLRLMALGVLADSIKINNIGILPGIVEEEIKKLSNTLIQISESLKPPEPPADTTGTTPDDPKTQTILRILNNKINGKDSEPDNGVDKRNIIAQAGLLNSATDFKTPDYDYITDYDFLYDVGGSYRYYSQKFATQIDSENESQFVQSVSLDKAKINSKINLIYGSYLKNRNQEEPVAVSPSKYIYQFQRDNIFEKTITGDLEFNSKYLYYASGNNGKIYYLKIDVYFDIPEISSDILIVLFSDTAAETSVSKSANAVTIQETKEGVIVKVIDAILGQQAAFSTSPSLELTFNSEQVNLDIIQNYKEDFFTPSGQGGVLGNSNLPGSEISKLNSTYGDEIYNFTFTGEYPIPTKINKNVATVQGNELQAVDGTINATFTIQTNDTALISSIVPNSNYILGDYLKRDNDAKIATQLEEQNKLAEAKAEQQAKEKKALDTQIKEALSSQSSIELTLIAIQLHALNKAIDKKGIDIGKLVYTLNIADPNDKSTSGATFLSQIFSNGIFSSFINELVNNTNGGINIQGYSENTKSIDRLQRLKIQAKYGFATSLMGNSADISTLTECDFATLLQAFVVPYQINQEIIKGTATNHPVYIPFGLLLMILNHNCTIYDSKENSKVQTPLVYIDFNNSHNYFLSNTKQLSTNPWVTLIPFEGKSSDYRSLFDNNILDGDNIKPASGSQEKVPLFNPSADDVLSGQLPKIKFDKSDNNLYRGRMMNILLNIDYLVKTIKDYSYKDGSNSIYLKEFIEQVLTDINKYLGKINVLRLSYNDKGNTLQIIDDQFIPAKDEEVQVGPNDVRSGGTVLSRSNTTELPLFGKYSIAKTLDIKSEVSSKLANTLAISANSDIKSKATLSKNGDNYGYINTSYQDRFVNRRQEVENNNAGNKTNSNLDAIINSATQFNQTISDFYSKINPSETTVDQATNYFIDKMAKIKNDEYPTRASAMIPVSVNFSTDGVSGFLMGQAFTIPDELLPYTYTARVVEQAQGLKNDHINKVGFVVVGLNHNLESNQWTTNVRASMIFLKDKTEFSGSVIEITPKNAAFGENENRFIMSDTGTGDQIIKNTPWSAAFISYVMKQAGVNFPSNPLHTGYLNDLKNSSYFELLDPTKNKIQVGDLIVFNRAGNNQTFSQEEYSGFSHGDIIVSISETSAEGIGGNVSNTVFKSNISLNNGIISNRDAFVIARPKEKIDEIVKAVKYEYNEWSSNSWKEDNTLARPKLREYYKVVNINLS